VTYNRAPLHVARPPLSSRDVLASLALACAWVAVVRPGGLDLPFFWDEADVYVPGSVWVSQHGLNVTPGVFPDDYSRGHPPLLYLIAGAAFAAFGASPSVGHLLILPTAVAALVCTYLLGAQLFGRFAGASAALLLGVTPLFMSMGNMLLPEMPLTALAVASFLAVTRGRVGLAALLGVCAVLMKETGIFAAAGVGATVLFDAWRRGTLRSRSSAFRIAWCTVPLFALLAFFIWQRATAGYFVYPHHANLFTDRPVEASNLITVFPSLFFWHGRWIVLSWGLVAVLLARRLETSPPDGEGADEAPWAPTRTAVLIGFAVLAGANALFFAKMFWLERYALPVHPVLLVAATGAVFVPLGLGAHRRRLAAWLPWLPILLAALVGASRMRAPTEPDAEEHTFAYADVIRTHRAALESIEAGPSAAPHVLTTWPMTVELRYAYLGYVRRDTSALNVRYLDQHPEARFSHVVVNTASGRAGALREEARRRGMRRSSQYRVGVAPTLEVWGRP